MVLGLDVDGVYRGQGIRNACTEAHTATRLIDRRIYIYTVKEWLGHSTIQVTERYAHLNPNKLVHAANMLEL
jgi:integrase